LICILAISISSLVISAVGEMKPGEWVVQWVKGEWVAGLMLGKWVVQWVAGEWVV
jgi:hypothetical protein